MSLLVKRVDPDAFAPTRAHPDDAGWDLYFKDRRPLALGRGKQVRFPLGVAVSVPPGRVGLIKDRSSLAARGVHVLGGVIDAGYTGEVSVVLKNLGQAEVTFQRGDRVAQLVVLLVDPQEMREVDDLPPTARGAGGFGSTGA